MPLGGLLAQQGGSNEIPRREGVFTADFSYFNQVISLFGGYTVPFDFCLHDVCTLTLVSLRVIDVPGTVLAISSVLLLSLIC